MGFSGGGAGCRAFLWNPTEPNATTGTMIDLGTPPGDTYSYAEAINDKGQVAGSSNPSGGSSHAFLWNPTQPNATTGTMTDLGTVHDIASAGYAINVNGQIAGCDYTSLTPAPGTKHALLYANWTMHDIGTLGGATSVADGINGKGQVVGWSYTSSGTVHGFLTAMEVWRTSACRPAGRTVTSTQ